jgi:hypothetical protein
MYISPVDCRSAGGYLLRTCNLHGSFHDMIEHLLNIMHGRDAFADVDQGGWVTICASSLRFASVSVLECWRSGYPVPSSTVRTALIRASASWLIK